MSTFVLVPGAHGDGPPLDARGRGAPRDGPRGARAGPARPGRRADLDACAAAVAAAAAGHRDVVVAGHSLGCFTAPLAADRIGARLLVLVCPMIPAPGESAAAWWDATGWEEARRDAGAAGGCR